MHTASHPSSARSVCWYGLITVNPAMLQAQRQAHRQSTSARVRMGSVRRMGIVRVGRVRVGRVRVGGVRGLRRAGSLQHAREAPRGAGAHGATVRTMMMSSHF